jgi:ATP-binding cassette subfamily B protein
VSEHRRPETVYREVARLPWAAAFRLLLEELNGLRVLLCLSLLLVVLASGLAAISPILFKLVVDHFSNPETSDRELIVVLLIVSYAFSQWLARLAAETRSLVVAKVDQRLYRKLSLRVFRHVMSLPFRIHADRKTGGLIQTLANGLAGYRVLIQHFVLTLLPVLIELTAMGAVLVVLGQPFFLVILGISLICYAVVFFFAIKALLQPARDISTASIYAVSTLADSVSNHGAIKSFGAESLLNGRVKQAFLQAESCWSRFFVLKALSGLVIGTIFAVALGTSMYFAMQQLRSGAMTLGGFVLVNTYMLQTFRPVEMLGFAFLDIGRGMAFLEKLIEVLDEKPELLTRTDGKHSAVCSGELLFEDICFGYHPGRAVLQHVSFKVHAGATVALVGASGSGKSSLIRLLMRFWEPERGRMFLDGTPVSEMSLASLRQSIAIIPQDTILFNDSIGFNIAIGRADSSAAEIEAAARAAGIHDFIMSRPDGYGTLVGERGMNLSAGERQRIAIARAVLKNPMVYVLDEATGSLDSLAEQHILSSLRKVSRGKTSLIIAHRLSTIVHADEILVLEDGRIVERGTHSELLQTHGRYGAMWSVQQGGP